MNRYYQLTDEQRTQLVNLELAIKENAIRLAPEVKKIVKQFDGKQLTKRLQTALQKIDKHLYVHNEFNSFDIKYIEYDSRYIPVKSGVEYIEYNDATIAGTCKQSAYGDSSITEDNRIIADVVISSINKQVDYLTEVIAETRDQLNFIDQYRQRKAEITAAREAHNDQINYTIRRYFDLEIAR